MVLKTFKAVKFHVNAIALKALSFSQTSFWKLPMCSTSRNKSGVLHSIGGVLYSIDGGVFHSICGVEISSRG